MSNILSKRNKVHHLDEHCDETQIPVFKTDVTGKQLNNPCLLPRRNWCSIGQQPGAGSLDVLINVEIDQTKDDGRTKPYAYTIPVLDLVPDRGSQVPYGTYGQDSHYGRDKQFPNQDEQYINASDGVQYMPETASNGFHQNGFSHQQHYQDPYHQDFAHLSRPIQSHSDGYRSNHFNQ